jgi:polysaccharide export outer membrane protein
MLAVVAPLTAQQAALPVTLQPGDLIAVEIWREPDLSGAFPVDESGMVTLPMIGTRKVAGIPIPEMRDSLYAAYRAQLRNPSINITPLRRVYVLGEVNTPGLLNVDPTISLAGAVALAGGANENGDLRQIRVIRDGVVIIDEAPATSALTEIDIVVVQPKADFPES